MWHLHPFLSAPLLEIINTVLQRHLKHCQMSRTWGKEICAPVTQTRTIEFEYLRSGSGRCTPVHTWVFHAGGENGAAIFAKDLKMLWSGHNSESFVHGWNINIIWSVLWTWWAKKKKNTFCPGEVIASAAEQLWLHIVFASQAVIDGSWLIWFFFFFIQ